MTSVDTSQVGPGVTLALLFGAAARDASPAQRGRLRVLHDAMRSNRNLTPRSIAERIFEVMGPSWLPDTEYLSAIDKVNEKR